MSRIQTPNVSVNPNTELMQVQAPVIQYQAGQYIPPNLVQYEQLTNILDAGVQAAKSLLDFGGTLQNIEDRVKRNEILKFEAGLADAKRKSAEMSLYQIKESYRSDGTRKSEGWVPGLTNSRGEAVTEYSVEVDGRLIPTINPYLTREELDEVVAASETGQMPSDAIIQKSIQFANDRQTMGDSIFPMTMYKSVIDDPSAPIREFLNSYDPDLTLDEIRIRLDEEKTNLIEGDIKSEQARIEALRKNNSDIIAYSFSTYLRADIFEFPLKSKEEQQALLDLGNDPKRVLAYLKQRVPPDVMNRLNSVDKFEQGRLENALSGDITWFMSQMDDIRVKVRKEQAARLSSENMNVQTSRLTTNILGNRFTRIVDGAEQSISLGEFMDDERTKFYVLQEDLNIGRNQTDSDWADLLRRTTANLRESGSIDTLDAYKTWLNSHDGISGDTKKTLIDDVDSTIATKTKAEITDNLAMNVRAMNAPGILQMIGKMDTDGRYKTRLKPGDFEEMRSRAWASLQEAWTANRNSVREASIANILRSAEDTGKIQNASDIVHYVTTFQAELQTGNDMIGTDGKPLLDPSGKVIRGYTPEQILDAVGALRGELQKRRDQRSNLNREIIVDNNSKSINTELETAAANQGLLTYEDLANARKKFEEGVTRYSMDLNSPEYRQALAVLDTDFRNRVVPQLTMSRLQEIRNKGFRASSLQPEQSDSKELAQEKAIARRDILATELRWDAAMGTSTATTRFRTAMRGMFSEVNTEGRMTSEARDFFEVYMASAALDVNMNDVFGTSQTDSQIKDLLSYMHDTYRRGGTMQNALADTGQFARLSKVTPQGILSIVNDPTIDPNTKKTKQDEINLAFRYELDRRVALSNRDREDLGLEPIPLNTDGMPYMKYVFNSAFYRALQETGGDFRSSMRHALNVVDTDTIMVDGSYLPKSDFKNKSPEQIRAAAKVHSGSDTAVWVVVGIEGQVIRYGLRSHGPMRQIADPLTYGMPEVTEGQWLTDRTFTINEIFDDATSTKILGGP